jgi:hypothetical protein
MYVFYSPFLQLKPLDIEDKMKEWDRTMYRLSQKQFKDMQGPRSVSNAVRDKLEGFRGNLQLISALRREGMQERHWNEIVKLTHLPVKLNMELTLTMLLDLGMQKHMEAIESVRYGSCMNNLIN